MMNRDKRGYTDGDVERKLEEGVPVAEILELKDGSGTAHTGELADSSDIRTDEEVQDVVGALIQSAGNISVTYDDAADALTIDTAALNEEEVEDAVAALVTAGNAITVNYDDAADALTVAVDESALSFYDGTNLTADVDNQSVATDKGHIKNRFHQPPISGTRIHNPVSLSNGANRMDSEHGRVWQSDGSTYTDDYGDTWTGTTDSVPSAADAIGVITDSKIFAVGSSPTEIWVSPYSTSGFSWKKVLSGQSGTSNMYNGGRKTCIDWNPSTGTVIMGERGPDSDDPYVYRSTDGGDSFSSVYQVTNSNQNHIHIVGHDPLNSGHWIATLGDSGESKFLESWDDGATWSKTDKFGPYPEAQAVGLDFSENYIFFAEDRGAYDVGPWVYHRETERTRALCGVHPAEAFDAYTKKPLSYAIIHDRDSGLTYFDVQDPGFTWNWPIAYVRHIGDQPQLLATVPSTNIRLLDGHLFNGNKRFDRGTKLTQGGI